MDTHDDPYKEIREGVRDVCRQFDGEYWRAHDRDHEFPWEFYRAMADGGWIGIAIPEKYGGGGRGITEASIVLEEVAVSICAEIIARHTGRVAPFLRDTEGPIHRVS